MGALLLCCPCVLHPDTPLPKGTVLAISLSPCVTAYHFVICPAQMHPETFPLSVPFSDPTFISSGHCFFSWLLDHRISQKSFPHLPPLIPLLSFSSEPLPIGSGPGHPTRVLPAEATDSSVVKSHASPCLTSQPCLPLPTHVLLPLRSPPHPPWLSGFSSQLRKPGRSQELIQDITDR